MSRKLFEQQLNELSVISENFTFKHQQDYKLDILKKCLETLQSANSFVEIPYELLEKIDKIFKLIPSHARYFVEIDRSNHQIYLNLMKELDEIVVKNYIGKVDEIKKYLKILVGNLSSIFLIYGFLSKVIKNRFERIEEYYGYVCLIFIGLSIVLFLYQRLKWVKMKHSKIY
jgi:hypothetical protein